VVCGRKEIEWGGYKRRGGIKGSSCAHILVEDLEGVDNVLRGCGVGQPLHNLLEVGNSDLLLAAQRLERLLRGETATQGLRGCGWVGAPACRSEGMKGMGAFVVGGRGHICHIR
jgi:hypothetical protein